MTSRAQVRVEANQILHIEGVSYHVAEHPALPGIPYVQRGGRGFVIQLLAPSGERMALKYFKLKYRVPDLVKVAESLRAYADMPGLRAARRTVFTPTTHRDVLNAYPALEYGMLMPWLPGVTWYDVITTRTAFTSADSLKIARQTAIILANLEKRGVAHCDLAGANVLIERASANVELVDIEEMYAPNLPTPVEAPGGQDGYQHKQGRQNGQWNRLGDRFSGAILLAEMLGWSSGQVRVYSADEHYFAAAEMQDTTSPRFQLLYEVLRDEYTPTLAELFRSVWHSRSLDDCPPLSEWQQAIAALPERAASARAASPTPTTTSPQPTSASTTVGNPVVSGRRALNVQTPIAKTDEAAQPSAAAQPSTSTQKDHISLEGKRLCRNCGAANDVNTSFCARCGFYIGTGARSHMR